MLTCCLAFFVIDWKICRRTKISSCCPTLVRWNTKRKPNGLNFSSLAAITWSFYFRSVTNLYSTIESIRNSSNGGSLGSNGLKDATGEDFLFLFDLVAHSCGLEATLRVLTHSDATFYEICKPNIDLTHQLELEEDKVKVKFGPADIERYGFNNKLNVIRLPRWDKV